MLQVLMSDPFSLHRFIDAQDAGGTYDTALAELRAGRKVSHWMWFVFPQLAGLGGARWRRCTPSRRSPRPAPTCDPSSARGCWRRPAWSPSSGLTAEEIFGAVDATKLRSSMTLFARAAPDEPLFQHVLDRYFNGVADDETDRRLLG